MVRNKRQGPANWQNRTLWTGDNLDILRGMNAASVDLIYLDPPFNSNQTYAAPIGSEAAGAAFKDTWTLDDVDVAWHGEIAEQEPALYAIIDAAGLSHSPSMKSYLIMMAVRLLEMRRVLKPTGSIYLHRDPTASHYLKQLLDTVFGRANFRNEIVWKRTSAHSDAKALGAVHDTILFYSKGSSLTRNRVHQPYDPDYIASHYRRTDAKGRRYRTDNTTAGGLSGGGYEYEWKGVTKIWRYPPEKMQELHDAGRLHYTRNGTPEYIRYLDEMPGTPLTDVWTDVAPPNSQAKERIGYPTQKPLALLERIITASSNPGNIVLDPFCGCATTLVAAEHLNRQWVGIDLSPVAARLVKSRLEKEMGLFYDVHHRHDIPQRTDLGELPHYKTHKHSLFGRQEGLCGGCGVAFPFRNFTIDHVVPRAKGGTDHLDNLQLLCGACNSAKGRGTQAELKARLRAQGVIGKGSGRRSA